jgi:hypothetical protein
MEGSYLHAVHGGEDDGKFWVLLIPLSATSSVNELVASTFCNNFLPDLGLGLNKYCIGLGLRNFPIQFAAKNIQIWV